MSWGFVGFLVVMALAGGISDFLAGATKRKRGKL